MQHSPGPAWHLGAIANGHVLVAGGGWVPLNLQTTQTGPRRPGDVINQYVFTGMGWVALPAGWWPDPTGRNQFRWWTGTAWSDAVMTSERQSIDPAPTFIQPYPMQPPAPPPVRSSRRGLWQVLHESGIGLYGGFWLCVAVYSVSLAAEQNNPRWLGLTATASMNIFLFMLTGKTRKELRGSVLRVMKQRWYYLLSGAIAAGGVALSLHFDDPDLLPLTAAVTLIAFAVAWAMS